MNPSNETSSLDSNRPMSGWYSRPILTEKEKEKISDESSLPTSNELFIDNTVCTFRIRSKNR